MSKVSKSKKKANSRQALIATDDESSISYPEVTTTSTTTIVNSSESSESPICHSPEGILSDDEDSRQEMISQASKPTTHHHHHHRHHRHHRDLKDGETGHHCVGDITKPPDSSRKGSSYLTNYRFNLGYFILFYVSFMMMGASLFSSTESPHEKKVKMQLRRRVTNFLIANPTVDVSSLNSLLESATRLQSKGIIWESVDPELVHRMRKSSILSHRDSQNNYRNRKLHDFQLPTTMEEGVSSDEEVRQEPEVRLDEPTIPSDMDYGRVSAHNWEFTSSLLFVTSLVTTIGYGHITPLTQMGKGLAIIWSVIGIPCTLTLLSILSTTLLQGPIRRMETTFAVFATKVHPTKRPPLFFIRLAYFALLTMAMVIICFLVPAAIFDLVELEWNYLDSLYYCWISLTTVGLGDFIPAIGGPELSYYRLATVAYLFVGLTFVMLWLAFYRSIPELNMTQHLVSCNEGHFMTTSGSGCCGHSSGSDYNKGCRCPQEKLRILSSDLPTSPRHDSCHLGVSDMASPSTSRSSIMSKKSYGATTDVEGQPAVASSQ